MIQNRALGREETLLRYPGDQASNLLDHPAEWYSLKPQYKDEYWKVTSFDLVLAGPGLISQFRGLGGAPGSALEFGLDLYDGYGPVRNLAPVVFQSVGSAKEWNDGTHNGTLVDLRAGNYDNGQPRAGVRGDVRQAGAGTVRWTSGEMPVRYGGQISGLTWEADLLKDDAGQPLDFARLKLEIAVAGPGGLIWSTALLLQTGAQLATGNQDLAAPVSCVSYRWTLELDFASAAQAAHRELATPRTSIFFLIGVWTVLDSPWWTIRSLADLAHRSEPDRELRAGAWDGQWDVCIARLPVATELAGRRGEGLRGRILQPGAGLKFLEVHAVTDVWYEET